MFCWVLSSLPLLELEMGMGAPRSVIVRYIQIQTSYMYGMTGLNERRFFLLSSDLHPSGPRFRAIPLTTGKL
jgi:hypothetical protein